MFENRKKNSDPDAISFLSTDGTDFRMCEPSIFWSGWCSHKFKCAALRYEIGFGIASGDLCWLNGTFPAGAYPDLRIFRMVLKKYVDPNEKVEADNGYKGESDSVFYLLTLVLLILKKTMLE